MFLTISWYSSSWLLMPIELFMIRTKSRKCLSFNYSIAKRSIYSRKHWCSQTILNYIPVRAYFFLPYFNWCLIRHPFTFGSYHNGNPFKQFSRIVVIAVIEPVGVGIAEIPARARIAVHVPVYSYVIVVFENPYYSVLPSGRPDCRQLPHWYFNYRSVRDYREIIAIPSRQSYFDGSASKREIPRNRRGGLPAYDYAQC